MEKKERFEANAKDSWVGARNMALGLTNYVIGLGYTNNFEFVSAYTYERHICCDLCLCFSFLFLVASFGKEVFLAKRLCVS